MELIPSIAKINKIAIIDDDFSKSISFSDLSDSDTEDNIADILKDKSDPVYQEYISLLDNLNLPTDTLENLANNLSNADVRKDAPFELKELSERVFDKRNGAIKSVLRVKNWIIESGFSDENILTFDSAENFNNHEGSFDLIIIDYLLFANSDKSTKQLIKSILDNQSESDDPTLFILMSSHEEKIKEDFLKLREEFEITSSRLRILKKPNNNDSDKATWLHTINQICTERRIIPSIETFIKHWGSQFRNAVKELETGLWGLDAHGLDILRRTASDDNSSFSEYFSEVIMRRVLAVVESSYLPQNATLELEHKLADIYGNLPAASGCEVGDSRQALIKLLGDASWHREEWFSGPRYPVIDKASPVNEDDLLKSRFAWIKNNIRFGSVIHYRGEIYLNLTQPCDIAHLDYTDRLHNHLLLFPGRIDTVDSSTASDREALSPTMKLDDKWCNIIWQLSRPTTPSIEDFISEYQGDAIAGQLRYDQAQMVTAKYAAKINRVATLRIPKFTKLLGVLLKLNGNSDKVSWELKSENFLEAHLLSYSERVKDKMKEKTIANFKVESASDLAIIGKQEDFSLNVPEKRDELISGIAIDGSMSCSVFPKSRKVKDLIITSDKLDINRLKADTDSYLDSISAAALIKKPTNGADISKHKDQLFILMFKE